MGKDYSDIGLNSRFQNLDSLAVRRKAFVSGLEFNANYEVQSTFLRTSRVQVKKFIRYSGIATALGTIPDGSSVVVSSRMVPARTARIMGLHYISVYEGAGSSVNDQIFPNRGANIANGEYAIFSGYNERHWTLGTADKHSTIIENNSGTEKVINFISKWMYIQENAGVATI